MQVQVHAGVTRDWSKPAHPAPGAGARPAANARAIRKLRSFCRLKGCGSAPAGPRLVALVLHCMGQETFMRYILAWALGVPGILVVLWFLMSHH